MMVTIYRVVTILFVLAYLVACSSETPPGIQLATNRAATAFADQDRRQTEAVQNTSTAQAQFQSTQTARAQVTEEVTVASPTSMLPTRTPNASHQDLLTRARDFAGTENSAWEVITETIDGVELVLVPVGCFNMGYASFPDARVHEQCITTPFWIDRYEVSNAQFAQFNGVARRVSHWDAPELPRETISWEESLAFCALRGGRLPSEAEWEFAARGVESWQYPWGNEFVPEQVNSCDVNCSHDSILTVDGVDETGDVTGFEAGASWVGAYQMSGNVQEWTSSIYATYPYVADDGRENLDNPTARRVYRGGDYTILTAVLLNSSARNFNVATFKISTVGFRCVMDG